MIIDLISFDKPQKTFDLTIEPDEINLEEEAVKLLRPARAAGEIKKSIGQADVSGRIAADVAVECTRCLREVERHLEFDFAAAFVAPENFTEAKEAELNADDLDVSIIEDNKIDLRELAREQILLNLPEQVFCSEECRGLCPRCGADLNETDCRCREEEIDPRWAGLKNLR